MSAKGQSRLKGGYEKIDIGGAPHAGKTSGGKGGGWVTKKIKYRKKRLKL